MKKQELVTLAEEKYFLEKHDIEELLMFHLGCNRETLFQIEDIPDENLDSIYASFKRVMQTEPVAYVTKKAEFYGREFYVDDRVLVPRVDTEVLVDKVLEYLQACTVPSRICDVGTGSGCIGQSVYLSSSPGAIDHLYAFDISADAVEVAKRNAANFGITNISFIPKGFDEFAIFFEKQIFSQEISRYIILANLPYIRTIDLGGMEKSVFFHEPSVALFGGKQTGFELYTRFIGILKEVKSAYPHIELVLFMEFGYDQYEISIELFETLGVKYTHFKDTKGIWRVIQVTF